MDSGEQDGSSNRRNNMTQGNAIKIRYRHDGFDWQSRQNQQTRTVSRYLCEGALQPVV